MKLNTQIGPEWLRHYVPAVLILAAIIFLALWLRNFMLEHEQSKVGTVVIATPAAEVKSVPKIDVQVKSPVKVYKGGSSLKDGLKLPTEIVHDDAQQVIASSQVKDDEHPHTITTTLNTETGESQTYVRTDPLPWFALSSRGGVGMYAGIKNGAPAVRLEARQELFSVKALHFGAVASVDQPISGPIAADYFVGLGAEYRW